MRDLIEIELVEILALDHVVAAGCSLVSANVNFTEPSRELPVVRGCSGPRVTVPGREFDMS